MTNQSYTYTPFGKASLILETREYAPDGTPLARPDTISSRRIIYGPDHQRWQTVLTDSTGVATTISYAPGCDVVQRGSVKTTSYYLEADGALVAILMGGDFMDGALAGMASGAITGAVIGGLRGYSNAETLGVNKITGGTLEERGQAWANYYGFEDVTIKPINNSTIEEYNEHSTTYTLSNNMGEIQATNKTTGVEFIIDGVTKINSKTIYLTKSTIRHASFNSGWGKGTFFHEYTHVINKSTDEYLPYLVGYKHGGASYYRRNEMMMKAQGINRY